MTLPGLDLQSIYLDLGWGVVAASIAVASLQAADTRRGRETRRPAIVLVAVACIASMWLPAAASPSYWLGMYFQYPSLLLVTLTAFHLGGSLAGRRDARWGKVLREVPAATLVGLGVALYAGTFLWIPFDLYAFGYWGFSAAILATVLVALWSWGDRANGMACTAVALAALAHAVTRLPTGNAWDAILDPLLFVGAACVLFTAARKRIRARRSLAGALR